MLSSASHSNSTRFRFPSHPFPIRLSGLVLARFADLHTPHRHGCGARGVSKARRGPRPGGGGAELTGSAEGWTAAGWVGCGGPRRRRPRSGALPQCPCCTPSSPRTGSPSPSSRVRSGGRSPAPSSSVSTHPPSLSPPCLVFSYWLRLPLVTVHPPSRSGA